MTELLQKSIAWKGKWQTTIFLYFSKTKNENPENWTIRVDNEQIPTTRWKLLSLRKKGYEMEVDHHFSESGM